MIKIVLSSLVLLFTLGGCGGGTTGTDGGSLVVVNGTTRLANGAPYAGADVTVLESGDSTKTDEAGRFEIRANLRSNQVTLLVERGNKGGTAVPISIKPDTDELNVAVIIDESGLQLEVVSIEVLPAAPTAWQTPASRPSVPARRESEFIGKIVDEAGRGVSGVGVRAETTKHTIRRTSDRRGEFDFEFASGTGRIILHFSYRGTTARLEVSGLPSKPAVVAARFVIRERTGPTVSGSTFEIELDGKPLVETITPK